MSDLGSVPSISSLPHQLSPLQGTGLRFFGGFTFPAISFDSALGSSPLWAGPGIERLHAQPVAQPLPQASVLREPSPPLSCSCEDILAKLHSCYSFR